MSEDEREREEHQSCPTSVALSLSLSCLCGEPVSCANALFNSLPTIDHSRPFFLSRLFLPSALLLFSLALPSLASHIVPADEASRLNHSKPQLVASLLTSTSAHK